MKKHWNKQLLALLLALLMLVLSVPFAAAEPRSSYSGQCGNNLTWSFDGAGTLTISGYGEMDDYYRTDAPWASLRQWIQTVNITAYSATIGAFAFEHCYNLETVHLPEYTTPYRLKKIGVDAFYCCTSLKEINLLDSINTIDDYAFVGCTSLKEIVIPESVTTLGKSPFNFCISMERIANLSMTTVCASTEVFDLSYPEGWDAEKANKAAKWIEENGFYNMFPAESNNPDGITAEMLSLFNAEFGTDYATAQEFLAIRAMFEQVPEIQTMPLFYCNTGSAEKGYCDEHGIEYVLLDDEKPLKGVCGLQAFWEYNVESKTLTIKGTGATWGIVSNEETFGTETVIIEEGITNIGSYTFDSFWNISDISFPESLISIGCRAFDSDRLDCVAIPKNVTEFDANAFEMCWNIERFEVAPENETYFSDENGCLFNKAKTKLIKYTIGKFGDYTVPDTVETIAYASFHNTMYLDHVTLGNSVKLIESYAFFQSALKSITIPNGVERIESEAFWRCGLSHVTLPASVEYIGYECFNECGLESITILNPDCVIECTPVGTEAAGEDVGAQTITATDIYGYAGSTAQSFAEKYNRTFHALCNGEHLNTYEDITPSTCTVQGVDTVICLDCGAVLSSIVLPLADHEWDVGDVKESSTCTVPGTILYHCKNCTVTKEGTLPLAEHIWNAGVVKTVATYLSEGEVLYTCTKCPETKTESIIKLVPDETKTTEAGISVSYQNEVLPTDLQINVDQLFDGVSFKTINREIGNVKTALFNITLQADGERIQPDGLVLVKLPIPEGYNKEKLSVYYISNEGKTTLMPSNIDGDYICFETDHFSEYAIIDETQQADEREHMFVIEITKEATCSKDGLATYTCMACDDSYTEIISATGKHIDENNDGKCDTCGEKMTGGKHCPQCGKIHNKGFIDKLTGFFHKIAYRLTHLFKK